MPFRIITLLVTFAITCFGFEKAAANQTTILVESLHKSLNDFLIAEGRPPLTRFQYRVASVQLDGYGPSEAIILIQGNHYCGTGGCMMMVFQQLKNKTYRFISRTTLCRQNIWLSNEKHYGWNELVIFVVGGGRKASNHVLKFNGNSYPLNPSVQPVFIGDTSKLQLLHFNAAM